MRLAHLSFSSLVVSVFIFFGWCDCAHSEADAALDLTGEAHRVFAKCLSGQDREVLLRADSWHCVDIRKAARLLRDSDSGDRDPAAICRNTNDRRLLKTTIVKEIHEQKEYQIGRAGIRLIGAIFCQDEMNLSNLDLPYPLVLDYSVFKYGIRAEQLHARSTFSLDDSFVFDNLALRKSKIDGPLFARRGFFENVGLVETEASRIHFESSVLHGSVFFDRVNASHDVYITNAALWLLKIQQSALHGRLDLTSSEARCAYVIQGSEIDEIRAADIGFGESFAPQQSETTSGEPSSPSLAPTSEHRYGWKRTSTKEFYKKMLGNATIMSKENAPQPCSRTGVSLPEFQINDVRSRTFCLESFHWLPSQPPTSPKSAISFNGFKVGGSMIINLSPGSTHEKESIAKRMLRLHGVNAGILYLNFNEGKQFYQKSIDRLQIDRIHIANDIKCNLPDSETPSSHPTASQVQGWLENNTSLSLQPYVAFIKAFENAGANPIDLKVAKADVEFDRTLAERKNEIATSWQSKSIFGFLRDDGLHAIVDSLHIIASWALGWIADYGYRPGQAIWTVIGIVLIFWLIFWHVIGVVAFSPEKKAYLRVVGLTFIFDRLIPVYKIRDDNYDISKYYQRGTGPNEQAVKYFGRTIVCVPASPRQTQLAEIFLDVLKALGIVLAVFLAAAINALVAR